MFYWRHEGTDVVRASVTSLRSRGCDYAAPARSGSSRSGAAASTSIDRVTTNILHAMTPIGRHPEDDIITSCAEHRREVT